MLLRVFSLTLVKVPRITQLDRVLLYQNEFFYHQTQLSIFLKKTLANIFIAQKNRNNVVNI